jgi:hypothetical protein
MIPLGNKTVTLIKRHKSIVQGREKTTYSEHIIKNCSWIQAARWVLYGDEKRLVQEITCRIPAGQAVPQADDYIFLGTINENIETPADIRIAMAAHKGACIQIQYVADNAHANLPLAHYACRGA